MDPLTVGKFLYQLRIEKRLTQEQLADLLEVTNKSVSRWECGEGYPSIEILVKLSTIFNVSVDEILKGETNIPLQESYNENPNYKNASLIGNIILNSVSILFSFVGFILFLIFMYAYNDSSMSSILLGLFLIPSLVCFIMVLVKFKYKNLSYLTLISYIFFFINSAIFLCVIIYAMFVGNTIDLSILKIRFEVFAIELFSVASALVLSSIYLNKILKQEISFKEILKDKFIYIQSSSIISYMAVCIYIFILGLSSYHEPILNINVINYAVIPLTVVIILGQIAYAISNLIIKRKSYLTITIINLIVNILLNCSFFLMFASLYPLTILMTLFSIANLVFSAMAYKYKKEENNQLSKEI